MIDQKLLNKIHKKHLGCRLCGSSFIRPVIPLHPIPIGEHYTKESSKFDAARFPIDIYQCSECSAVQTNDDIDNNFLWKDYTYFSGQTKKIIEHFNEFSKYILNNYTIPNKNILDIGSNDGTLLKQFKSNGFSVQGIDPADTVVKEARKNGIPTELGLFNEKNCKKFFKNKKFDIITAFNVFAHSQEMQNMAKTVFDLLKEDGIFCFEVQYLVDIIKKNILGTFFHEHMIHYSYKSAKNFLGQFNLEIIDYQRNNIQHGSIIFIAAKKNSLLNKKNTVKLNELDNEEEKLGLLGTEWASTFYKNITNTRKKVTEFIDENSIKKNSLAGYGAARSGPTIAIQFEIDNYINILFDDHKSKKNKYAPFKSLKVIETKFLSFKNYPFTVILAYIHYKQIIKNHLNYLRDGGSFIILWPFFKVINKENYSKYVK